MRETRTVLRATSALLGLALVGSPASAGFRAHRVPQQPAYESATLRLLESLQDPAAFGGTTSLDLDGWSYTALEPETLVSIAEADALTAPTLTGESVWVEAMSSVDPAGTTSMISSTTGSLSGGDFFGTAGDEGVFGGEPIELASLGVTVAGDESEQGYASGGSLPRSGGDGPTFAPPGGYEPVGGGGGFTFAPPRGPYDWRDRPPVELVPLPPPLALGIVGLVGVWLIRRRMTSA